MSPWAVDALDGEELRGRILTAIRWIEREPTLLGASAHLLAVARNAG